MRLFLLGLKGRADCLTRRVRACGAYVDMLCRAVALAIVIYAVLYRAIDALDVILTASVLSRIVHFVIILSFLKTALPTSSIFGKAVKCGCRYYDYSLLRDRLFIFLR